MRSDIFPIIMALLFRRAAAATSQVSFLLACAPSDVAELSVGVCLMLQVPPPLTQRIRVTSCFHRSTFLTAIAQFLPASCSSHAAKLQTQSAVTCCAPCSPYSPPGPLLMLPSFSFHMHYWWCALASKCVALACVLHARQGHALLAEWMEPLAAGSHCRHFIMCCPLPRFPRQRPHLLSTDRRIVADGFR
jgi:hypothetical protein